MNRRWPMKVSAHPLMVAVALGLLGPGALAADTADDDPEVRPVQPPGHVPESSTSSEREQVERALDDQQGPSWGQLTLHPADAANGWEPPR